MFEGEEFYSGYWDEDTQEAFNEVRKLFLSSSEALEFCIRFAYANIGDIKELREDDMAEEDS